MPVIAALLNDPYAIYSKARDAWERARYPQILSYTIAVEVSEAGEVKTNHYHLTYDALHDVVHVNPTSDEELAHPHKVPPGPKINIFAVRVGAPESRTDYLGVPRLAPNYSFGIAKYVPPASLSGMDLVREIRAEFHDPAKATPAPQTSNGLPEIASVTAIARNYHMTLAGTDIIGGHPDYHLVLEPLHDPKRYRLRDLWIDRHTYFTDRLTSDGNFVSGPGPGVRWTVDFAAIGGAPYIATEQTESALRYPGAIYQRATVTFQNIKLTHPSAAWSGGGITNGDTLEEPQPR